MTDPYQVLGVSPSATDEQIKNAYRELARKYHPDNYVNNPLADLAQEKMKEINEAYDQIQRQRKQQQQSYPGKRQQTVDIPMRATPRQSYSGQGRSQFADIRQLLNSNRLSEAEELLEGIPQQRRDAEWYYLRGRVFYVHGWLDQGVQLLHPGSPDESGKRRVPDRTQSADVAAQHRQTFGRIWRLPQRPKRRDERMRYVLGVDLCRLLLLRMYGRRSDQLLLAASNTGK